MESVCVCVCVMWLLGVLTFSYVVIDGSFHLGEAPLHVIGPASGSWKNNR